MADRSKIDTAQAGFQKLLRDQDGKKAASEYERAAAAVRANTARLRTLRLARDAARGNAPAQEAAPPRKKPVRQTRPPTGSLSGWLKDREKSGRNN